MNRKNPFNPSALEPIARRTDRRFGEGFTLVEILITIAILAIGMLGTLHLQIVSVKSGSKAESLTTASLLAESEIERLRAFPNFNRLRSAIVDSERIAKDGQICRTAEENCPFSRNVALTERTPTSRSHTVTVEILWSDSTGPQRLVYDAVFTDYNLGSSI
ncbi:MAG: prepilin-type N-terminal cleavage/methylation domain-containing protein [Deltaproteobacteria bacterium]|nr:prepilin-type N-terminal cleavage/methylation domain-containing protein [Deltaproteobacteria bacterium]